MIAFAVTEEQRDRLNRALPADRKAWGGFQHLLFRLQMGQKKRGDIWFQEMTEADAFKVLEYASETHGGGATRSGFGRLSRTWNGRSPGRVASIQRMSPVKLRVLIAISGGRKKEAELHQRFAASRLYGEWFEVTPELRAFLFPYIVRGCIAAVGNRPFDPDLIARLVREGYPDFVQLSVLVRSQMERQATQEPAAD